MPGEGVENTKTEKVHKYPLRVPLVKVWERGYSKQGQAPCWIEMCVQMSGDTDWLLEGSTHQPKSVLWVHVLDNCYNTLASSMASIHLQRRREGTLGVEALPGTLVTEPVNDETTLLLAWSQQPCPTVFVSLAFSKTPRVQCKGCWINAHLYEWVIIQADLVLLCFALLCSEILHFL